MLESLSNDFELILYTCGTPNYANTIAEAIEDVSGKKYFDHILDNTHCLLARDRRMYLKDIKILEKGRDMKDMVIVDNNL